MEELLAIFCDVDDFCRDYEEYCQHHLLMDKSQIKELSNGIILMDENI